MGGMIVTAGGDHCRRAIVLNTIRILVDALVQLRGSTQRERPEERCRNDGRDERRAAMYRARRCAHCTGSLSPAHVLGKKISTAITADAGAATIDRQLWRSP